MSGDVVGKDFLFYIADFLIDELSQSRFLAEDIKSRVQRLLSSVHKRLYAAKSVLRGSTVRKHRSSLQAACCRVLGIATQTVPCRFEQQLVTILDHMEVMDTMNNIWASSARARRQHQPRQAWPP